MPVRSLVDKTNRQQTGDSCWSCGTEDPPGLVRNGGARQSSANPHRCYIASPTGSSHRGADTYVTGLLWLSDAAERVALQVS